MRKAQIELEKAERELAGSKRRRGGRVRARRSVAPTRAVGGPARLRHRASSSSTGCASSRATTTRQVAVDAAQERARCRPGPPRAAEDALAERRAAGLPEDPAAEADALRTQIEAVERSLGDAEAAREAEVDRLEQEAESARRDSEAADRQLERALDRMDGAAPDQDIDAVVAELRHRREELTAGDSGLSAIGRVLRDLALDAPEPLFVLIEPAAEPGEDLIGALISVSGLKRTVVVTDKTEMLHEAREMEPALGAVREPLETGGTSRQELARSDGNRT